MPSIAVGIEHAKWIFLTLGLFSSDYIYIYISDRHTHTHISQSSIDKNTPTDSFVKY